MKVPSIEELKIEKFELTDLIAQLKKKVGTGPLFIKLDRKTYNEATKIVDQLSKALSALRVDPHFPYPIYIITEHDIIMSPFSIFSDEEQLPNHFKIKSNRLKNKEISLLQKSTILAKRVSNHNIEDITNDLNIAVNNQRALRDLVKENLYYEKMLKNLEKEKRK
ncbi:hypothetical protein M899_0367 [Bacteriovorax sp. BSW11_IV]|uniref:hypothetical protein n=1 Tax=Bacteriovorax sp. BSW11_IV TaxID=1353529 RepID=UPI000389E53E|nr:hypothetical protein [Bacteriovorax sp. BSW11_IV]EQC43048.1 hypothetical protein M899_0367 [Bacteriovorax sp. BSW11_IV]